MANVTPSPKMALELKDGSIYEGLSFGANRSVAGELVFQSGMVGYPESLTDASYRGQILVFTYPLVGNYGVPSRKTADELLPQITAYLEGSDIHIAGLIVASYAGEDYSHHLASSSLGAWLQEQNVPAIHGVDTRVLTKKIREKGSMLGRILIASDSKAPVMVNGGLKSQTNGPVANEARPSPSYEHIEWVDPNQRNLVAEVSCRMPHVYSPSSTKALLHPSGRIVRVLCIDVGLKYNQLRCLVSRGVEVEVVPWDSDLTPLAKNYDGLFLSNGPGDPAMLTKTVDNISHAMKDGRTPIFGICLGHQLLARAAGAPTLKMKFGNRGHNIPCTSRLSGKCYITSQNHGYAVDATKLPSGWEELFVNANDKSNEGIRHVSRPFFSVQFHPESNPGPRDTEFLFDVFINTILTCLTDPQALLEPVSFPLPSIDEVERNNHRPQVKKALVLGSGGLSIGQAGEFDYSGSQAIKALKEEGIYTILLNPNIATIQTSKGLADEVYFLPVTADSVRKIIDYEHPDAIYVTFGGQTALQVGIEMKNEFAALGVQVLGTPIDTIITTEDRQLFAESMESIGEKCAKSASATSIKEAKSVVKDIGFPVIVRAAYALGGLGSGFAENEEELLDLCNKAFAASPQVLIERSMKGWKEIEYEVVRDAQDNCITVCNMENFDPLGIHTGDSIVVAPSQTLSDQDHNMLRTAAIKVIRYLGVVGECNIQYALNPFSREYCIIEVNARLSRSSALASKATGYPLAFIAAKLGLGIPLYEIPNSVTKVTCAFFEPSLDFVVVKIPRWDLKKFTRVSTQLSSSMKSVGEVMSIGRTFEEAIQKAIRAVGSQNLGFMATKTALMSIDNELQTPSDQRLFAIANAMHSGYSVDSIWEMTRIDKFFLKKLQGLIEFGSYMTQYNTTTKKASPDLILQAKKLGFSDAQIADFWNSNEFAIRQLRISSGVTPFVKQIDTCAGEFPADTNYLYTTYNATSHDISFNDHGILVLGSGAYRIGSSVEFDWCAVRSIRTLRENNFKSIMVNCNPETVSTDFDESDRLYFENIALETVLDIYQLEMSSGTIISMGGQVPNNLAVKLERDGVKILGTSPDMIDKAENRKKFSRMLESLHIDQPSWKEMTTLEAAELWCEEQKYPVLVRPSFVLSGAAMNTVYSKTGLANYLNQAAEVSENLVVITKFIENAKEVDVDAVALDGELIAHFVTEHLENAGVHSGDATLILPPQDLDPETVLRIEEATRKIGKAFNVTGPFNIQFIAKDNAVQVIECNIQLATKAIMGLPVQAYPPLDLPKDYVGVKVPQFSFSRLSGADPVLGVEMASTGEVACFGRDKYEAYLKALIATGFKLSGKNVLLSIGNFKIKEELLPSIVKLSNLGYCIYATTTTFSYLSEKGVAVKYLESLGPNEEADQKSEYSLTQALANKEIDLIINLPSNNHYRRPANYMSKGYRTRRMAADYQIPLVTNVKNAKILIEALARRFDLGILRIDCQSSHRTITLPGLINVACFVPGLVHTGSLDVQIVSKASIASGFSMIRVMPIGLDDAITDYRTLKIAQQNIHVGAYCDYNFSVAATSNNAEQVGQITGQVGSLFIPFNHLSGNISKLATITSHFAAWPDHKPIITDAKTTDLAFVLFLASLHNRKVHVTNVSTEEDIHVLALSKSKGLQVTCDVAVYSLFLSRDDYPACSWLPTKTEQGILWKNLKIIDIFSIGNLPYHLVMDQAEAEASPTVGISDTLPLLFTAVSEGRLTLEDVVRRLHDNPKKIFELHDQVGTVIEIEMDRLYILKPTQVWSPFTGRSFKGAVKRVTFQDRTVSLDGEPRLEAALGKDMSSHLPVSPKINPVSSVSKPRQESPRGRGSSFVQPHIDVLAQIPQPVPPLTHIALPQLHSLLHNSTFKARNILAVRDFSRQDLHLLFTVAQEMRLGVQKSGVLDILRGRVLCNAFYEPSTRTSASFDAAMQRLGGHTVPLVIQQSSTQKGETLQDTLRTLGSFGDAVVLRHPDESSVDIAAKFSPVPVINGGNGSKEHPTQAFLDLFTIREELGSVNGLTITFVGDLRFGRTVHSLCQLLRHYNVSIQLVSPPELSLPSALREEIINSGQLGVEEKSLTPAIIARTDVLYCTRVQKERFNQGLNKEDQAALLQGLRVDNRVLKGAKPNMIVMHPLPRNEEIDEEVDFDPRAAYFRQMRYGMYCRMALLALILYQ